MLDQLNFSSKTNYLARDAALCPTPVQYPWLDANGPMKAKSRPSRA